MVSELPAAPDRSGLQSERTALAWRRTALGLATGSVVAGRVLAPTLGASGWALAAVGVVLAGVLGLASHRRSLVWHDVMRDARRPAPGGVLPTACAAGALALAVLALVLIVTG